MDQVDEIKSKVDIVEIISSYVPLKKMGRNLGGLCPFHKERTPSFMVSPERQAFKCFGCGESGDVFTFLEKVEGWEFRETLEELAKRVGVKLKSYAPTGEAQNKEKLIAINKLACRFWSYILVEHKAGGVARKYLENRGIPKVLWEKFGLGFAPGGWENLSRFLTKKGYTLADMATAGLVVGRDSRGSGYYDRFRDRLMFPIKDARGVILGFSGRVIKEAKDNEAPLRHLDSAGGFGGQAKYINSPQTPIFHKGNLLFGLDVARGAIREKNLAVLVEGEFDVMSLHKIGVENVLASKGTALTVEQVMLLRRFCDRLIMCFDSDLAGDAAARRGVELLDNAGISVKVATLGKFKDPDEFAQKDPKGLRAALNLAADVFDYLIDSATKRFDPKSAEGKKKIGVEILPVVATISDDLVRAHYIEKLARILGLDTQLVAEAVTNKSPNVSTLPVQNEVAAGGKVGLDQEEYFLALVVFGEEVLPQVLEMLTAADFALEQPRKLWSGLRDIIKHSKTRTTNRLVSKLPGDLAGFVDNLYLVNISPEFNDRELWAGEVVKVAKMIRRASLKRQLAQLSAKIREAQAASAQKETERLFARFIKISVDLKTLAS